MNLKHQFQKQVTLLEELIKSDDFFNQVEAAVKCITISLRHNYPLLICGNGGSASDALHISGELVCQFLKKRQALNVICLNSNVAVLTAWSNDNEYDSVFARQVEAHGQPSGVLWGISTSGNSKNIIQAIHTAKQLSMTTITLTGKDGGQLADLSDILIRVPSTSTPRIQELHLPIYHYICEQIEAQI
ncbi:MAG: SIS domain-containing protein [Synechococcales bacterium]|nr:SIS domain-containing protein [Cyanobacteria bacterium REEB444]MEB3124144.1 SIS domain-containing protein [Synechococcales bacterium]